MSDQDILNHLAALNDWDVSITRQRTLYTKDRKTITCVFDADGALVALRVGNRPVGSMSRMMTVARRELQR